jgi:hypothetical protein
VQYFTTLGYLRSFSTGVGSKNPKSVSKRLKELLDDYSSVAADVVVWATEDEYDLLVINGKQVKMLELAEIVRGYLGNYIQEYRKER